MTYDWVAALVSFGIWITTTAACGFLIFRIPALYEMCELNRQADVVKLTQPDYRKAVRVTSFLGFTTIIVFYVAILPFSLSLRPQPLWHHALDLISVLLLFDLFYYLTHRFLYHRKRSYLGKMHAKHHRARQPTYIDAQFTHPLETVLGQALLLAMIPLLSVLSGSRLHAVDAAIALLIFTGFNVINHSYVNLPYFPFKSLTRISQLHAAHHVDGRHGNFALFPLLYDQLFGTLEAPAIRSAP